VDGVLFLVVGPSGAGKDSLLQGARAALAGDERYVFARRVITRPADAGGEDHVSVGVEEFAKRRDRGEFMAWWEAHDLHYGLPRDLLDDLAAGRHVVANVSRAVVGGIAERVGAVRVVQVTAPAEVLAARLDSRGREGADAVARRLARRGAAIPDGIDVVTVVNDGSLDEGISRFIEAISP
jgi:thymidine phosphorylase